MQHIDFRKSYGERMEIRRENDSTHIQRLQTYLPLFGSNQVFPPLESVFEATTNQSMALLSSILGFSIFGLSARLGQLGIQKRNLLESAHASYLRP
jgi:hypothetical protein